MTLIQMMHVAYETWAFIFCLLSVVIVFVIKNSNDKLKLLIISIMLTAGLLNINEAMAYVYRGNTSFAGGIIVRVTNYLVFFCGYVLVMEFSSYINEMVYNRSGRYSIGLSRAVVVIELAAIILLTCSRIWKFYYDFDEQNRYYRLDNYWFLVLIGISGVMVLIVNILVNRKCFSPVQLIASLSFSLFPLFASILQISHYGISIYNIVLTASIVFLFMTYIINNGFELREAEKKMDEERIRLLEKEVELNKEKVRLYHSQIQPHFIFNTLTMLRSYLDEPQKAEEILNEFTDFLRGSIDMFSDNESIPLSKELVVVENYLALGKDRFGEKLTVNYDIRDKDFNVPPFSVQTLVENALVHGIRKKKGGRGTISLRSYKEDDYHIIEVEDDGAGFDVGILEEGSLHEVDGNIQHKHIGINNTIKRLEIMSGGRMEIVSIPDKGTVVKIFIPV
ncbi:MAG: histidine kinase [Butyrivibrio sp.]|nr:histidine kinase [Butyrivibrio sp.]